LLLLGAWAGPSLAQPASPPGTTAAERLKAKKTTAAERLSWRARMAAQRAPIAGCFAARFPVETWTLTQCADPPKLPHTRPLRLSKWRPVGSVLDVPSSAPAPTAGQAMREDSGGQPVAIAVGTPISAAEGSFDQTMGLQSVTSVPRSAGAPLPGYYALQLNTEWFQTPACARAQDPTNCHGWIQFLFMNDPTAGSWAEMEVFLLGYGPSCPGKDNIPQLPGMPPGITWDSNGADCSFFTQTTRLLPKQSVWALAQLRLRGEATAGGQDSVTITLPDGRIEGVGISDDLLKLSAAWHEVEFNVFGAVNSLQTQFNPGAALVVHVNVENGTSNPPMIGTGGYTGESNNFNILELGCPSGGPPPSLVFEEFTLSSQRSLTCPPKIPAPPPPPTLTPCQVATKDVANDQGILAKAQARQSQSICKGPASVNCAKAVQSAQLALNAAIIRKNKACMP
jgi:hypothetical protein